MKIVNFLFALFCAVVVLIALIFMLKSFSLCVE